MMLYVNKKSLKNYISKKSKILHHKNYILKNNRKFSILKITKNYILKNNQKFTILKITKYHILKNNQKFNHKKHHI